ncbi:JAB domain-containing protein [Clostridioides difficile]
MKSGEVLKIQLVDHIIVGDNDKYFSFKENNKI